MFTTHRPLITNVVWSRNGSRMTHSEFIWDRRRNLQGQEIVVTFVHYKPFFYNTEPDEDNRIMKMKFLNGSVFNMSGHSLYKARFS